MARETPCRGAILRRPQGGSATAGRPQGGYSLLSLAAEPTRARALIPSHDLVALVGNFGSGKTEICINWALWLAAQGQRVSIVDLDIVNPYFRSREVAEQVARHGVEVIMPQGEQRYADLPILVPEVRAAIHQPQGTMLLDVGGDDLGARVLGYLEDLLKHHGVYLLQVVNTSRPFTETLAGCKQMQVELERASKLLVDGYIANTHLMQYTDQATIMAGHEKVAQLSEATGVPVVFTVVEQSVLSDELVAELHTPVLPMRRFMLNPWQKVGQRPIGVPPVVGLPAVRPGPAIPGVDRHGRGYCNRSPRR